MKSLSLAELEQYSGKQVKLTTRDKAVHYGLMEIEGDAISFPEGCKIVFPFGKEMNSSVPRMMQCQSAVSIELI